MTKFLEWFVGRPRMLEASALLTVLILALMVVGLTGCVQTISTRDMQTALAEAANQEMVVPTEAGKPCEPAPLPRDVGDVLQALAEARAFGTLQTGFLSACEVRRQLAVDAIVTHNKGVRQTVNELRPPTFWERIFGKRKVK